MVFDKFSYTGLIKGKITFIMYQIELNFQACNQSKFQGHNSNRRMGRDDNCACFQPVTDISGGLVQLKVSMVLDLT